MRKLRLKILSWLAPVFPSALRAGGAVSGIEMHIDGRPGVARAPRFRRTGALVAGASLGAIAATGFAAPAYAQTAEEACAFAASLRSVETVSRVLERYADDECVPTMLVKIPPRVLSRLSPELVASLPPSLLQYFPPEALAAFGVNPSIGTPRSIVGSY